MERKIEKVWGNEVTKFREKLELIEKIEEWEEIKGKER